MIRSLTAGVSGIQQFQSKLDVIGNNIANSNTYGFKSGRTEFEDALSQSFQASGGVGTVQIGSGVGTGAVRSLFGQGTLQQTGVAGDMAVDGDGFFVVRDSISGNNYATRAGDFHVDSQGFLVNNQGYRVQGFTDGSGTARGDLRIDDTGKPDGDTSGVKTFRVEPDGKITIVLQSGQNFVRGQVLLQRFQDPNALVKDGNNLFSGMELAGPLAQPEVPGTNGLGEVRGSQIESSNVDLSNEFSNLIVTQRGFQASARIITTSDELLQEVVNLKR
jgi:flagellar hook protein FlgE